MQVRIDVVLIIKSDVFLIAKVGVLPALYFQWMIVRFWYDVPFVFIHNFRSKGS